MQRIATSLVAVVFAVFAAACGNNVVGPPGPPGRDGALNVRAVHADLDFRDDRVAFTDYVANISFSIPEITRSVVDEGMVLVYLRDLEGTWTALPYSFGVEAPDQPVVDYTVSLGFAYEHRRLDVFLEASSADDVVWDDIFADPLVNRTASIKVVIVDGYFLAGKSGVDFSDYEAVKAHFGLED